MTVTITTTKHDIPQNDDNDNGTCNSEKYCDHTESLLKDLVEETCNCNVQKKQEKIEANMDESCDIYYEKSRQLLDYDSAPEFMQHNIFIRTGYRRMLNTKLCFDSVFWWTNETINIWSHLFGFVLFFCLSVYDVAQVDMYAFASDKVLVGVTLICFQACMLLSAIYHTFCCKSKHDCDYYLSLDLLGIALSLLTIYISGIYYAFWCETGMQHVYIITVTGFFVIALALQHPRLNVHANIKTLVFVAWAVYGVIPTLHWTVHMGGFDNPLVSMFVPRVIGMYTISGVAFIIYITKIPERFFSGKVDYLGHSHQWWHILVTYALYYWHNSGVMYLEYRMSHACPSNLIIV